MRRTMKRTIILTAIFLFLANATKSYAQKDADNFYKSPAIRTESVSFQNLYKNENRRCALSFPKI